MEHAMAFDTLQYVKKAREAGFTESQAEFQAEEMAKVRDDSVVHLAMKDELIAVKNELKTDIQTLRSEMKTELVALELRITSKMGYMLSVAVAILGVLIAFFHK